MNFEFSEEEEMFRDSVREFSERYIQPKWVEVDESNKIPYDLIKKMADQGLFGIPISEEYGGMGGTYVMTAIAVEEVAYYDPAVAIAVYLLLNNGWPYALELFGSEEAKSEILPKVVSGEAFFGIASTEPQGGSDVAGIKTFAEKKDGVWILNGEKSYISGVREVTELPMGGGWFLVAKTGSLEWGHRNITAFAVLPKWNGKLKDGFKPTIYEEIGRGGLSTGGFILENFEVEDKYVIGELNKGFYHVMEGFNLARILVAAACVGSARWALDAAMEWLRNRKLFQDRRLSSFQGIQFKLAELYADLEAARLFTYKAAWLADKIYKEKAEGYNPKDLNIPVALAKMKAPETATRIYEEVLKWHGAYGYTKESNVYRGWIGTFSYTIGAEGAQNIMRIIIARDLLGREYVRG
ncbi:acyl-CoA dehydrogenase [Candidatus Geothermarchaeota archaeon]|nr:MAG: acyl-CoA dehydrogenase [Candidatus Geothermarchaeota archaeon]HEW93325.1 acyl-CoA dehydrogenase [Thermoprotei archaeon]